jgi:hypothetical protein
VAKSLQCHNGDLAWVDDDQWEELNEHHWYSTKIGVFRHEPDEGPKPRSVYLHREVMGNPQGLFVGFVDGDKRNCQRGNLFTYEPGKKHEALARHQRSG